MVQTFFCFIKLFSECWLNLQIILLTFRGVFIQCLEDCQVRVPCSCDHIGLSIRALPHRLLRKHQCMAQAYVKLFLFNVIKPYIQT